MAVHDPGPWRIVPRYMGAAASAIESADGQLVATVHDAHAHAEANARLIAQTPRMYEVLDALVQPDAADNLLTLKDASLHILEAIDGAA